MIFADGQRKFHRGFVGINDCAVRAEFQRGIRIQLRERRELLRLGIGAAAFHRHADGGRHGQKELHLVRGERALVRRVDAENAEGSFARRNRNRDAADDAVLGQKRRRGERLLRVGVWNDDRLAGIQRETDLRIVVAGNFYFADVVWLPADARLQKQLVVCQPFPKRGVFHFERLSYEQDGLVQEGVEVAVRQGKLPERGDDGLLQRAVEKNFFRFLPLGDALLQRGRHDVERLRQLAELTLRFLQARACAHVALGQPLRGVRQRADLAQDEMFPAKPRRNQCQQPDNEAHPRHIGRKRFQPFRRVIPEPVLIDDVGDDQRRRDDHKNAEDQLHAHAGKSFCDFFNHFPVPALPP